MTSSFFIIAGLEDFFLYVLYVTSSKNLIEAAMASPKGEINMCNALKELKNRGRAEGMAVGLQNGKAQGIIKSYKSLGGTQTAAR